MHRRTLFMTAAGAVIAGRSAYGDVPVIDIAQIAKVVQQIAWLRDQYEVLTQNLRALTNSLNLGSIAPQLLSQGLQNPFGQIASQLPGLVGGTTLGSIPGAQQILQQDRLFQPAGSD